MATCEELMAQFNAAKAAENWAECQLIYDQMEAQNCQPMPQWSGGTIPPQGPEHP
jgi:hypothetical protein